MEYKYRIAVLIAQQELATNKTGKEIRTEAAQEVGLSYSQFNRISRARKSHTESFTAEALNKLATYFKVKAEEIFNGPVQIKKEKIYEFIKPN